jgi:ubiquinone/menaquinone biosynthesis C-methylase UbiE
VAFGGYPAYCALVRKLVPGLRSSQYEYYRVLRQHVSTAIRWLDTGCGHQFFPEWMVQEAAELRAAQPNVTGIDRDLSGLRLHRGLRQRVYGDLAKLPFRDAGFELVSANMVVEHIADPVPVLDEMRRVLVPGGVIVLHTPNAFFWAILMARVIPEAPKRWLVQRLEGRPSEDIFPTHYQLNSARRIRRHATAAGLEVVRISRISSSAVFHTLGYLALPELLYLRVLRHPVLAGLRSNLVVELRRPSAGS